MWNAKRFIHEILLRETSQLCKSDSTARFARLDFAGRKIRNAHDSERFVEAIRG